MKKNSSSQKKSNIPYVGIFVLLILSLFIVCSLVYAEEFFSVKCDRATAKVKNVLKEIPIAKPELDTKEYDRRMLALANNPLIEVATTTASSTAPGGFATTMIKVPKVTGWPVKAPYPLYGAVLPFKRIIAYYGNFYSRKMGALGEYDPPEMLQRLRAEVKNWETADPTTPVVPAIHYIAVTARSSAQADNTYKLRMPHSEIDKAVELAKEVDGIVFLDIQVGLSDFQTEIPLLEKYLKMPQVHLGLDPEFSMKSGDKPGDVIGTMDATDINYAAEYLAKLVKENNLPPKVLVIHRFTQRMVTNYQNIKPLPEVQVVIEMDGWGAPARKINTYNQFVASEPVQFTGFKIFYKNDLKETPPRLLTPAELLSLRPIPIYIQYQ